MAPFQLAPPVGDQGVEGDVKKRGGAPQSGPSPKVPKMQLSPPASGGLLVFGAQIVERFSPPNV